MRKNIGKIITISTMIYILLLIITKYNPIVFIVGTLILIFMIYMCIKNQN